MKPILAVCLFFLLFNGCPDPCGYYGCGGYVKTYGVGMDIKVQAESKTTTADVEVVVTHVSYNNKERTVKRGEYPYDEEIKLKLHWFCPTEDKSGEVEVTVAEMSATGKVKISGLPRPPLLTIYPWEFKRGIECVLMTEDEKIAQDEEKAKQNNSPDDSSDKDDETSYEEKFENYRGKQMFFIKNSAPDIKLNSIKIVAGNPDSYVDIEVELLRSENAVVAGDRSFDLEVEVKLPWSCEGVTPLPKSDKAHIIIPAGASNGTARLIMPPAKQTAKLKCAVDANAYIDGFIIGKNSKTLEFGIPEQ